MVMSMILMLLLAKIIKNTFLAVLLTKMYVLMIDLARPLFFTKEKTQSINLLKQFLKKMVNAKND